MVCIYCAVRTKLLYTTQVKVFGKREEIIVVFPFLIPRDSGCVAKDSVRLEFEAVSFR
jgi:hypothetical protein